MNREEAIKATRSGAYAAFVSSALTVLFIGVALRTGASDGIYGLLNDPMNLLDVVLMVGLGIGLLRKSRAAAIGLIVYWLIGSVTIVSSTGLATLAGFPLRLIFLYFFARGVQGAYAYHRIEKADNPDYKPPPKLMYWIGIPAALLTGLLVVLGLLSESGFMPPATTVSGAEVPARFREQLVTHGVLMADEPIEHFYTSGVTTVLDEGNVLTDRRVLIYWRNEQNELEYYDLYFDEIAEVRILKNGRGLELSEYQVTGHDPELWLLLQLAPDDGGDKRFLRALRRHIRNVVPAEPPQDEPAEETATI